MALANELKALFQISKKSRFDTFTDQYHRIFMVKLLLACTIIVGFSWYGDKINCVMPDHSFLEKVPEKLNNSQHDNDGRVHSFISPTCWIQGLYIYRELRKRFDVVAYYGVPKDLSQDGFIQEKLCRTENNQNIKNLWCKPMERTYYLQYQWLPFYVCALTLLYYMPYIFFTKVNKDIFTLKRDIKAENVTATRILKTYFTVPCKNGLKSGYLFRQTINIIIKLLYLAANIIALAATDRLLEGEFLKYGIQWIKWTDKPNTIKFDYKGLREFPKPGNELFPPFGLCDVYASSSDRKNSFGDEHTVLCEMSQHILFQYTFMVIWFAMVIGIGVSAIGVIMQVSVYVAGVGIRHRRFCKLTYRQREYLEYIHTKNRLLYKEIVDELKERYPKQMDVNGNVPILPLERHSLMEKDEKDYNSHM